MPKLVYSFSVPDFSAPPISERFRDACDSKWPLIPFTPDPLVPADLVGQRIDGLSFNVGSYGMGGPGFAGLRLGDRWLVIAIWGAASWIHAGGRLVEDSSYQEHGRARPWGREGLTSAVVGHEITAMEIAPHSLRIALDDGPDLVIRESPDGRAREEQSSQPRAFSDSDDLRRAVFLAPTDEIWI